MSALPSTFLQSFQESSASPPRRVVCHCLNVAAHEIEYSIQISAAESVKDVIRETGAGSGCTACHCTIRAMLQAAGCNVTCGSPGRFAPTGEPTAIAGS